MFSLKNITLTALFLGSFVPHAQAYSGIEGVTRDDVHRSTRMGFGLGLFFMNYAEHREFQPLSGTGKTPIELVAPSIWGSYTPYISELFEIFLRAELYGTSLQMSSFLTDFRLHHFFSGPMHLSGGLGSEWIPRFEPGPRRGFSNLFLVFMRGMVAYRWDKSSSFPKEIGLVLKYGRPFSGGEVSYVRSYQYSIGLQWRIPVGSPLLQPTSVHEEVLVFEPRFEKQAYRFNEARAVLTDVNIWFFSLGYEF